MLTHMSDNNDTPTKTASAIDIDDLSDCYVHAINSLPAIVRQAFYDWWVLDSGSSVHICNTLEFFADYSYLSTDRSFNILTGKGTTVLAEGVGIVYLMGITHSGKSCSIRVLNVLYVSGFMTNIISLYCWKNQNKLFHN